MPRIYTRTGDDGTTALGNGQRAPKDARRVAAYGTVDELNAVMGVALAHSRAPRVGEMLTQLQRELFSVCSDLCVPEADQTARVEAGWVTRLEQWIDELSAAAPPLRYFVVPGGAAGAAYLHLARTVCRRAEREVVTLARAEPVGPAVLPYLNRLSDLLFSLAHYEIHQAGSQELLWQAGATGADTKGSH